MVPIFFRQGLYASFGLNTYYFITAFIGLWHWTRDKKALTSVSDGEPRDGDDIVLNRLSWRTVAVSALVFILGTAALSAGMTFLHDAGVLNENPMSLLDSAVTALSVVATWWLVRSYLEQWWLWIVADVMTAMLCLTQGMWWMAVLYIAYVIAAVIGLVHWKKRGRYVI